MPKHMDSNKQPGHIISIGTFKPKPARLAPSASSPWPQFHPNNPLTNPLDQPFIHH